MPLPLIVSGRCPVQTYAGEREAHATKQKFGGRAIRRKK